MWWFSLAWGSPVVQVQDDGWVYGRVEVGASASALEALIRDPILLNEIIQPDARVSVRADADPSCQRVELSAPHPLLPTAYVSRDCWSDDGLTSHLVSSPQLAELDSTWAIEPHGDHSVVEFQLRVRTVTPFPSMLVVASTKRSVSGALRSLETAFPL